MLHKVFVIIFVSILYQFWQYVNMRTKTTSGIANLEIPQNTLTSKDAGKAEILANFFTSVFTKENLENMPTILNYANNTEHRCGGRTKGVQKK